MLYTLTWNKLPLGFWMVLGLCGMMVTPIVAQSMPAPLSNELAINVSGTLYDHDFFSKDDVKDFDYNHTTYLPPGCTYKFQDAKLNEDVSLNMNIEFKIIEENAQISGVGTLELIVKKKSRSTMSISFCVSSGQASQEYALFYKKNYAKVTFRPSYRILPPQTNMPAMIHSNTEVIFENERDEAVVSDLNKFHWGIAHVTVPKTHEIGKIEKPGWLQDARTSQHIINHSNTSLSEEQFFSKMNLDFADASNKDVLVYIHGYKTSFNEAVQRTAQIVYDIHFAGVPVTYSWPSLNKVLGYAGDETNAALSSLHFAQFLSRLSQQYKQGKIHILAYSMGNRVLVEGLYELAKSNVPIRLGRVIMAAPDVDKARFEQKFPTIQPLAERYVIYICGEDIALNISKDIHRYPRVGQTDKNGRPYVLLPQLEVMDVTKLKSLSFLGHDYHASHPSILHDISEIINENKAIQDRQQTFVVRTDSQTGSRYYRIQEAGRSISTPSTESSQEQPFKDIKQYVIVTVFYGTDRKEQIVAK